MKKGELTLNDVTKILKSSPEYLQKQKSMKLRGNR